MGRAIEKLTPAAIVKLTKVGRYADGGGLYLQVSPSGGRSWLFRFGRRWMGLGVLDLSKIGDGLATARRKATECREQLRAGKDPLDERRALEANSATATARVVTFEDCAKSYIAKHEHGWKSAVHRAQWRSTLAAHVYPVIGKLPVSKVDIDHVSKILDPIWHARPETARRIRGRVERILSYAAVQKMRSTDNPFSVTIVRELLGRGRPKAVHHASMPYKDVPAFMRRIETRKDMPSLALQWLILTCTRSSEARCATWDELDLDKAIWAIPGARMKGGVQHTVPISLAALGVLKAVHRRAGSPYVFPGQGDEAISDTALRAVLRELGIDRHTATLHGFRSSFRDWAAETGIADDIAESCLAHAVSDKVVAAYKRTKFLDARKDVMLRWGLYLS